MPHEWWWSVAAEALGGVVAVLAVVVLVEILLVISPVLDFLARVADEKVTGPQAALMVTSISTFIAGAVAIGLPWLVLATFLLLLLVPSARRLRRLVDRLDRM